MVRWINIITSSHLGKDTYLTVFLSEKYNNTLNLNPTQ